MPKINFQITDDDVQKHGPRKKFGPGNYKFEVVKVEQGAADNENQTPYLEVHLSLEHDGRDILVKDNVWLTAKAKWKYIQFLKGLGIDPTDDDLDTDQLEGIEGVVRMRKEKDSNFQEVGEYYSAEVREFQPLGPFPEIKEAPKSSVHGDDEPPF